MFDQMVEGADKYITEQGSTWLIFTKEKKWVVEFTNDKTLWFNYNLFKSELELIGKDCTEERDFIKNWYESRFLGIKPVEDTIQNGVRHTRWGFSHGKAKVEDTIQNGVKETTPSGYLGSIEMKGKIVHQIESPKQNNEVEDAIQNRVRRTSKRLQKPFRSVKDAIQNGVKDTKLGAPNNRDYFIEDTIQNGVKQTFFTSINIPFAVEDTIQNGVRHTRIRLETKPVSVEDTIQNGVRHTVSTCKEYLQVVEDTIQNGVRHTEVDGMRIRRGVKDAIQEGVKETRFHKSSNLYRIEDTRTLWGKSGDEGVVEYIIQEGVKDIIEDSYPHKHRVEGVIKNTVKDGI